MKNKKEDIYTIELLIKDDLNVNKLTFKDSNHRLTSNHIIISTPKGNHTINNVYNLNNVKSYKILENDN
jgi:hypothetical protein